MKKSKNLINFTPLAIGIVVVVIALALYLVNRKINLVPKATTSLETYEVESQVTEINSTEDLDAQLEKLDKIDVDQINTDIINNETDSNNL